MTQYSQLLQAPRPDGLLRAVVAEAGGQVPPVRVIPWWEVSPDLPLAKASQWLARFNLHPEEIDAADPEGNWSRVQARWVLLIAHDDLYRPIDAVVMQAAEEVVHRGPQSTCDEPGGRDLPYEPGHVHVDHPPALTWRRVDAAVLVAALVAPRLGQQPGASLWSAGIRERVRAFKSGLPPNLGNLLLGIPSVKDAGGVLTEAKIGQGGAVELKVRLSARDVDQRMANLVADSVVRDVEARLNRDVRAIVTHPGTEVRRRSADIR